MNIALDWDGTVTRNPVLWDGFVALCKWHDVDIRIVTMRTPDMIEPAMEALGIPIIFTSMEQKRPYVAEHVKGWHPDIWIDDTPEFIVDHEVVRDYVNLFAAKGA